MKRAFHRTELLIGKRNMEKLKKAKICICGIGGVGSYALEALVRTGIGSVTIIDYDEVDITNINRQIIATVDSVNKAKVEVAKERIQDINPEIQTTILKEYIDKQLIENNIDNTYDYVIDAIDTIDSKIALIEHCTKNDIPIISSMGMANRMNPCNIEVKDIYKTTMCPLAKKLRKALKEKGIKKLKTVSSIEEPMKMMTRELGSIAFVPSTAGLVIASEVIKDIISGGE
ncbi:MAG: tRNA threonylcarbamoyladenosine dehydratase [Clostridia bacterium]|nr:tRNA threonylcarbamoyladenosine dehydratase [Clostridia bacterium]MDD4376040.1 tRNA threonylcarbamoyladenosine dehydratase [Clostridia bacterium]